MVIWWLMELVLKEENDDSGGFNDDCKEGGFIQIIQMSNILDVE